MNIEYHPGFIVYENGEGPVYVSPHSGPALGYSSRDDGSDSLASRCFERTGGTLIVSNVPRNPIYGIDLNRARPPKREAISVYNKYKTTGKKSILKKHLKKYGWIAKDAKDYEKKNKIYTGFWKKAKSKGNFFVIIHRKYSILKNYPSIMDFMTFDNQGVDRDILKEIINNVNEEYKDFFVSIKKPFVSEIVNMEDQILTEINLKKNDTDINILKDIYSWVLSKEMKKIKENATEHVFDKVRANFTKTNFLHGVRSALNNMGYPEVTLERIFQGKLSFGPKNFLINRNSVVLQIESDYFINKRYAEKGSEIIFKIVSDIKKVESYKKIGLSQRKIKEYLEK